MQGIAWLLDEELFDGKAWPGFFIEAAVFLLIAALAGWIASKALQAGAPPVPEQAIEEAKLTKEMLERGGLVSHRRTPGPLPGGDPPRHRPQAPAARRPRSRPCAAASTS